MKWAEVVGDAPEAAAEPAKRLKWSEVQQSVPDQKGASAATAAPSWLDRLLGTKTGADEGIASGVSRFGLSWLDRLLSGSQGVSAGAAEKGQLAPAADQALFDESGSVRDAQKQFVARNPQTGKMAVYLRSPEAETSRLGGMWEMGQGAVQLAVPESFGARAIPKAMTPAIQMAEDYRQAGVRPNLPAVAGSDTASRIGQAASAVPIIGQPVRKGIQQTLESTAQAATRSAEEFGQATEPAEAGASAQNAMRAFAENKTQATSDYNEFHRLMHGAPPTPLPRTLQLLQELRGRFPSNPELVGLFTNPKLSRLAEALEPRTETIPAQTSRMLNEFGQPAITRLAQTVQKGGALTTNELKELRSQVGYLLENPSFGPEAIPRAQLRRLYAGLSADMQTAARARSPAAASALAKATLNYGTRMRVLDRLDGLINNPSADAVFARLNSAGQSAAGGDAQLLQMAKKAMPQEEWGNLTASIIAKMGRPTPGTRDILSVAPDFSLSSFSTNWNKLSGRAKDLLFGADEVGSKRAGLERLARVVQSQKNVGRFANVSRSGELIMLKDIATALGGVATGAGAAGLGAAAGVAGVGAGGWAVSKALMSPKFTNWLYQLPREVSRVPKGQLGMTRGAQAYGRAGESLPKPEKKRDGKLDAERTRPTAIGQ